MVFDTAIDSHSVLPLTLDEALRDWSMESPEHRLLSRRSEKAFCIPTTPPATRKNSFEFYECYSHEKVRGESFSSDGSAPSMVEDHSGLSDSDTDISPVVIQSPWPPFSSEVTLPHQASHSQSRIKSRHSKEFQAVQRSFIPVPTPNQNRVRVAPLLSREPYGGQLINTEDPLPRKQATSLHRSHAQRAARHGPNTLKSLPATPQERERCSLQPSRSTQSRSQPPIYPLPHRQHPTYRDLPYQTRPATNPCNSSHGYSFHNTPPLPALEKSAFDYDTDDESHHDIVTQLSTSIASKMHIRGLSLGSKLGLGSRKEGSRYEGTGGRRSATEIVMGVFSRGKK